LATDESAVVTVIMYFNKPRRKYEKIRSYFNVAFALSVLFCLQHRAEERRGRESTP
jgi:hypothetical protein